MAQFRIENFSFSYPNQEKQALTNNSFAIEKGQFVVVAGPSASGKTTLLRNLNPNLIPAGKKSGKIYYQGQLIENLDKERAVVEIGMVFQDPENQIVMDRVSDEIAFSLENIGMEPEKIRLRIAEIATYFGLDEIIDKDIASLSGGQKQIVNLCSALALRPDVLIFDEPSSRLDPLAAKEFLNLVKLVNSQLAVTIIISEHRLDGLIDYADQIILLDKGRIVINDNSLNFSKAIAADDKYQEFLPQLAKVAALSQSDTIPLNVKEARSLVLKEQLPEISFSQKLEKQRDLQFELKNLSFAYTKADGYVLRDIDLRIEKGDFIACLGANASGKSSLLKCMAGITKPLSGRIYYQGKRAKNHSDFREISYVAQNPLLHFSQDSVAAELENKALDKINIDKLLAMFDLTDFLDHHPYDLSGGQQQKLAIVMALAQDPKILLIDEPTKGLDPVAKRILASKLKQLNQEGLSIVCASHDLDFVANNIEKTIMLFNKEIIYQGKTRSFLSQNSYYTTDISLVFKQIKPDCVSSKDVEKWIKQKYLGC